MKYFDINFNLLFGLILVNYTASFILQGMNGNKRSKTNDLNITTAVALQSKLNSYSHYLYGFKFVFTK